MKLRSITRHVSRLSNKPSLKPHHHRSSSSWYRHQSTRKFSSNLDNKKENLSPIKKVSKIHESIENVKHTMSDSFWSFTALDKEHKQWIDEYNKELIKHNATYLEVKSFGDLSKWIGYIGSIGFDAIQRLRMRPLKANLICYEEFMVGALRSFKSIQSLENKKQISRCFTQRLCDQMGDIKHALFDTERAIYRIQNIHPLANSLYFMQPSANVDNIEMRFNVRYYYSLQNMTNDEDVAHKYADIEWIGVLQPHIEDNKFKRMNLSDEGFRIKEIEVDNL